MDYLTWFKICPISVGEYNKVKIKWDRNKDEKDTIRIIAKLAILLAHIRGAVKVFKTSEHEDLIPIEDDSSKTVSESIRFFQRIRS